MSSAVVWKRVTSPRDDIVSDEDVRSRRALKFSKRTLSAVGRLRMMIECQRSGRLNRG
ncbi:MAG: hypothetical protein ACTS4T_01025 [Candidatus Hodgkinia cicadicola]